ncbi:uncharacterized protein LOC121813477, partial [Haplochromis burtoni]|uniref:uncharacterized protein LOC121813477 n=1 Tax=Haplochromis burtoni TaxID=8153 RepID=UPI001C2DC2E7
MWVNIYCCLLALSGHATAGLTREVVTEGTQLAVRCPYYLQGKVRWSRESGGSTADILTVDGDRSTKHISDPQKRYDSQADGSLIILRAAPSDSGRYFCNSYLAEELTVIPSGTIRRRVEERGNVLLRCPGDVGRSAVPTWRRDSGEINERRMYFSRRDKTLTIREAEPADSGLYYCGGKPAAYVTVTKGQRSDRGETHEPLTIKHEA